MAEVTPRRLAAILEANREEYNGRFEAARYRYPRLDGGEFLEAFAAVAAPLFGRDGAGVPEAADRAIADTLYDAVLVLAGTRVVGSGGHCPDLARWLPAVLCAWPRALREDPAGTVAGAANALLNLAADDPGRAGAWRAAMHRLGADDPPSGEFTRRGIAAAWVSGMASFRAEALAVCADLSPKALWSLFNLDDAAGVTGPPSAENARTLTQALFRDPWLSPVQALRGTPDRRQPLFRRAGGHRAFGGPFESIPVALRSGEEILIQEGPRCYRLHADWFGTTLVPLSDVPTGTRDTTPASALAGRGIARDGMVLTPQGTLPMASCALSAATACVTATHSYNIFIYGLSEPVRP